MIAVDVDIFCKQFEGQNELVLVRKWALDLINLRISNQNGHIYFIHMCVFQSVICLLKMIFCIHLPSLCLNNENNNYTSWVANTKLLYTFRSSHLHWDSGWGKYSPRVTVGSNKSEVNFIANLSDCFFVKLWHNFFQWKELILTRKMSFQIVSCEDQYQKCPQLNRSEVLELLEWKKTQPHLPNITGRSNLF